MTVIKTFQDLLVWQKSHALVLKIYITTKEFPKDEIYALTSQIRRAAASVPANIVEGFARKTPKDNLNFCRFATASLEELKYHLLLARDLKYLPPEVYKDLASQCDETGKLLYGWSKNIASHVSFYN